MRRTALKLRSGTDIVVNILRHCIDKDDIGCRAAAPYLTDDAFHRRMNALVDPSVVINGKFDKVQLRKRLSLRHKLALKTINTEIRAGAANRSVAKVKVCIRIFILEPFGCPTRPACLSRIGGACALGYRTAEKADGERTIVI